MDLAIIGMNSIGIDLYLTLKKKCSRVYLIGKEDEPGMAINQHAITLRKNDVNNIISIVNENIKSRCILYFTNDIYTDLIMEEHIRENIWFNENIIYYGIDYAFYSKMRKKESYHGFLEKYGLNTPASYDSPSLAGELEFPIICKYNGIGNENYKYKNKLIMTRAEFEKEITQDHISAYIFQKYYPKEDYSQYSYGCFVNGGEILADIYVRQVGQYPKGVSTLVIEEKERPDDFIISVGNLLRAEAYSGFIEFEILRNEDNIVVIDINPRPWGWFYILNFKYRNFPELASMTSLIPVEFKKTGIVWVNYNRMAAQLVTERSFGIVKHIRINQSLFNSLYFAGLFLKRRLAARL
ncbi:hypothetical protein ACFOLA_00415 [Salinicoccus hispanicus]|uniref:ATP-grasp domain-containing protein n=1 Tax=Salinicoccus hispanicus TaxID=157225 RepID=A0A6N8TVV7_9STAP|nr:hypothetical protein [Salinicoccus hispanicus]MXQ50044.1 hypothetical protein [Salinicoccus hispanicus]